MERGEQYRSEFSQTSQPSSLVKQYHSLANPGPALNLGSGEAGDALFLARQGYDVISLDESQENIEKAHKQAEHHNLTIDFRTVDLTEFKFHKNRYGLIVANNRFQHLKKSAVTKLAAGIIYGLKKGGMLIGATLTTGDPACRKMRQNNVQMVEENCFILPNGWIYSYFKPREILELFPGLQIVHYAETDYYDSKPGQAQWHGLVEFVFKKT
jgi:2-polyprenyl-3-methyl-5-hydroxy-6-metoxy-1,4-benzoquinol methylase